jgi:hypothetical protein
MRNQDTEQTPPPEEASGSGPHSALSTEPATSFKWVVVAAVTVWTLGAAIIVWSRFYSG